jgi:hypothetical protein
MTDKVNLNKLVLMLLLTVCVASGAFAGYYYTRKHYETKSLQEFSKNQEGLICQAEIRKGHKGDVKSEFFIYEQGAKQEDCEKYIDYKNLPDDTESIWLGF